MPSAKQYAVYKNKWASNEEAYNNEKKRVNEAVKNKYHNDPEFRQKCILYQQERRKKLSEAKEANKLFAV
jgi:hypothetical protein